MNLKKLLFLILLLSPLWCSVGWGATYCVFPGNAQCTAESAPNVCCTGAGTGTCAGVDGAGVAGTVGACWATMNYAESRIAASGDTVNVAAGKYYETDASYHCFAPLKAATWIGTGAVEVYPDASGTKALRITGTTVQSFSGFIFDARRADTVAQANAVLDANNNATNRTFSGCTFRNYTASAISGGVSGYPKVVSTGNTYLVSAGQAFVSGDITSTNDVFTFSGTGTKLYAGVNGWTTTSTYTNPTFNWAVAGAIGFDLNGSSTLTITGGTSSITAAIASIVDATRNVADTGTVTVTGHTVTSTTATTAPLFKFATAAMNVTFTDNILTGLVSNQAQQIVSYDAPADTVADYLTVNLLRNTINTGASSLSTFRVRSTGEVVNLTIDHNTLTTDSAANYVLEIGTETPNTANCVGAVACVNDKVNPTITWNTVAAVNRASLVNNNPSIHNIFVGHNKGAVIKNNYSYGGSYGAVLKHSSGSGTDVAYCQYNDFINNTFGTLIKGYEGVKHVNNTIVNAYTYANPSKGIQLSDNTGAHSPVNVINKNNIIDLADAGAIGVYLYNGAIATFDSDYNLFYLTGANPIYGREEPTSFPNWTGATSWVTTAGHDAHSATPANPQFFSATDYRLKTLSPARALGVSVAGVHDQPGCLTTDGKAITNPPNMGSDSTLYTPSGGSFLNLLLLDIIK